MLRVHAFFHLNLMFSSIEEESRANVIKRCYWPILELAERIGRPIGIEATGYTLEEIARLDPAWIAACRKLMDRGLIEIIGSGYAQVIGPLFPACVTEWNLKLGHESYDRLLGRRPRIALINEQAYSAGILPLYAEAGYQAIFMDWDMCAHAHPEWDDEWRYHAQIAQGDGAELPVLWTNTVLFQKLQRLAHGDIEQDEYLSYVLSRTGSSERTIALYSGDAEVFDFRPGRYKTEAAAAGASEWARVTAALEVLAARRDVTWITPSQAAEKSGAYSHNPLHLELASFPIPVKKQIKYNVSRWAVTGRADFAINRACRELAARLVSASCNDTTLWRRLCWLASSDFRTHITEKRFAGMQRDLAECLALAPKAMPAPRVVTRRCSSAPLKITQSPRLIEIAGPDLSLRLDPRKGMAIESLSFAKHGRALIGTIPHGTYDDLVHAFDWFSGTLIAEFVGQPKVTDLASVKPELVQDGTLLRLKATIPTPFGAIEKTIEVNAAEPEVRIGYVLHWPVSERGTLRIGNITLLPENVDPSSLYFETHNGGRNAERFPLAGETIDHGTAVSFLVSASSGIGMTEGTIVAGDAKGGVRITASPDSNAYLGLVAHRMIKDRVFYRIALSAAELDETRKPSGDNTVPLRLGYSLSPV